VEVALNSILNQSFKDLEVLIIDGSSNDSTIEIAKRLQLEFPVLKIICEEDKGIYDAMNKGISIAKGEWLYFMGSDDSLFENTTLKKVFNYIEENSYEVIYGNVLSVGLNGIYDGEFTYSKLASKNICHQAIFFKRSVFEKTGKFNLKYKILSDWDHNIKWFFSSKISKSYIDQVIANYSDGGISSIQVDKYFYRDKNKKLFFKGKGKISISQYISICRNASLQAKQDNSFILESLWALARIIFEIVRKLKDLKN
tara:strand:+ start:12668 stop:13432 length:765 start_codon:yes stop_codon:yes gene_type:complete